MDIHLQTSQVKLISLEERAGHNELLQRNEIWELTIIKKHDNNPNLKNEYILEPFNFLSLKMGSSSKEMADSLEMTLSLGTAIHLRTGLLIPFLSLSWAGRVPP